MSENENRWGLLSKSEITDLYAIPKFNAEEKSEYFSLSEPEFATMKNFGSHKSRLYFILQLGYFKAKQQFFSFNIIDVIDDAEYINARYFDERIVDTGKITREYRKPQREAILKLFGYVQYTKSLENQIKEHLLNLVKVYPKAHNSFRQLIAYLDHHKILLPTYRTIQDIFTAVYKEENARLNSLVNLMPESVTSSLDDLISNNNGLTDLNVIRTDQKDFQYTAVRLEVEKAVRLSKLYEYAKLFIPKLELSNNAVSYYADITLQYTASRLRRLNTSLQRLHLVCFVYHQYQQIMDNLITSFIYHVRNIVDAGVAYADMALLEHNSKLTNDFPKLAQFIRWFPRQKDRPELTYEELSREAYKILPEDQFNPLADLIEGTKFDKKAAKWEFYEKSSRIFALYLRPILLSVNLEFYLTDHPVIELISLLKNHYASGKQPSSFKMSDDLGLTVPKTMIKYLKSSIGDKYINPHRFEFYVYEKIFHHLNKGRLFCNDSVSYRDLECDLVDDSLVDNIEEIADKYGYEKIPIYCEEYLDRMLEKLDQSWQRTTQGINAGENLGINIKTDEKDETQIDWTLRYDASDPVDDTFLNKLPKVEIANLLKYIGDLTNMWPKFSHRKNKYVKRNSAETTDLVACLLAEAFGVSIEYMAEMSDLNYNTLRAVHEDLFSIASLCGSNDLVADFIHSLPIFSIWNLIDNKTLADADGQKMPSTNTTLQSRYSTKYIGKGTGISIYTLMANFVAVNAKNIGPNEYEGHSLYDMVYGNKTDISIDMVTGDNHSVNKFNYVFLDSINVAYVPSIKNIRGAADDLYSVKDPDYYTGILKPKDKIDDERIRKVKRSIKRVLISLALQENTQTILVKKLNNHDRYVRLKAGLIEYNKIFTSIHTLNMIHDMGLRKSLRSARNRTESYHSLQSVLRKVFNGIFNGTKVIDNRVSAHATRLVANCIIAYNAVLLNSIYEKMLETNVSAETIKEFARISPIAWAHIVFTGRYNFLKNDGIIDIALLVSELERAWRDHRERRIYTSV